MLLSNLLEVIASDFRTLRTDAYQQDVIIHTDAAVVADAQLIASARRDSPAAIGESIAIKFVHIFGRIGAVEGTIKGVRYCTGADLDVFGAVGGVDHDQDQLDLGKGDGIAEGIGQTASQVNIIVGTVGNGPGVGPPDIGLIVAGAKSKTQGRLIKIIAAQGNLVGQAGQITTAGQGAVASNFQAKG